VAIDKHLKTLVKFLREFISRCEDPKLIEHNQKQIKAIEGLLEDVKHAVKSSAYQSDPANKLIESFFSTDSMRETSGIGEADNTMLTQAGQVAKAVEAVIIEKKQPLAAKRRKLNEEGDFKVEMIPAAKELSSAKEVNYESADEKGTTLPEKGKIATKSTKKLIDKLASTAKKPLATPSRRTTDRKLLF
jgi:hypothetical protein